jgi:transcriptional regulator with XRE-family HTH domain
VINVQEWAEIRHLHVAEGLSQRAIADRLGIARKTVARALASQGPPLYSRPPAASVFDAFEDWVRGLLMESPPTPTGRRLR